MMTHQTYGFIAALTTGDGEVLFRFAATEMELKEDFMRGIGEGCTGINNCCFLVGDLKGLELVKRFWRQSVDEDDNEENDNDTTSSGDDNNDEYDNYIGNKD
jgi:hypothetical protein